MSTKPLRRKFISHNILHYLRDCVIIILYEKFFLFKKLILIKVGRKNEAVILSSP